MYTEHQEYTVVYCETVLGNIKRCSEKYVVELVAINKPL